MSKSGEIEKLLKEKSKVEAKGQWKEAAAICNCVGQELCKIGQFNEALQYHNEELELCTSQGDKLGIAVANRRIGECYTELNQFKKALHHQKIFLDVAIEQGSTVEEQRAWATLGRTYYFKYLHENEGNVGDDLKNQSLDKAEHAYLKALELCVCLKDQLSAKEYAEMRSRLLLNLGLVFERRRNLAKCAESIRHAIFLTKKFNLYEDLHRCQYSLASVYQACGQYNYALRLLDESISSAKLLHDKTLICEAYVAKANILILLKDFEGARTYLKKAYKIKTLVTSDQEKIERLLKLVITLCKCERELMHIEKDNFNTRKSLFEKMGDALASAECYNVAIEYYMAALECLENANASPKEKSAIIFSIAQTYSDIGKFKESLEYFWKEFHTNSGKYVEQIKTLWKIAEINYDQGNFIQVEETLFQALNLSETCSDTKYKYRCLKRFTQYKSVINDEKFKEILDRLKDLVDYEDETSDESEMEDTEEQFIDIDLKDLTDSTDSDVEKELYDVKRPKRATKRSDSKRNELGETPLHRACITGNFNLVKHLVETGHPVNMRDNCGWLPLHEACNYGYYEIVEYLLMKEALVNDRGGKLCDGITPLHDAAACGNFDIMELLISKGASVTALNNIGETPYDCLFKWWERSKDDLDSECIQQCKKMLMKLKELMKQVGQNVQDSSIQECMLRHGIDETVECSSDQSHLSASPPVKLYEKRNRSSSLSSVEDEMYINPHLSHEKDNVFDDPSKVQSEYQAVMSSLRRNKKSPESGKSTNHNKPPALLDENNIVTDWLIQDTVSRPQKTCKKRRKFTKQSTRKTNQSIRNFLTNSGSDCDSVRSLSPIPNVINEDSTKSIESFGTGPVSLTVNRARPQTLLSSQASSSSVNLLFRLRIYINDKVILLPVPDDASTIEWLADEAAKRYHNLTGSKPHLLLTSRDGALLSSTDFVKAVLQNNEDVMTTVLSWEHPSLLQRYEQNCQKNELSISHDLGQQLSMFETTFQLNLSEMFLSLKQLNSLVLCLPHYETLIHLNLNNVKLTKEVLPDLINCIPSFKSLLTLNLSCCSLTSSDLEQISCFLKKNETYSYFPKLQVLDLSYNSITSENASDFAAILKLPSLEILNLSGCSITSSFFSNQAFCKALEAMGQLKELNISGNNLDSFGVSKMLSFLPKTSLVKFDLSYSLSENICLGEHLYKNMLHVMSSLEKLHLQGCYLNNNDFLQLTECLPFIPKLQLIDLSSNPDVNAATTVDFIMSAYQCNVQLKVLIATGICEWHEEDFNSLVNVFRLKLIAEILIDCVPEHFQNLLFNAWMECWGSSAICVNDMLCELSINRLILN